jgi:hypothetical protein
LATKALGFIFKVRRSPDGELESLRRSDPQYQGVAIFATALAVIAQWLLLGLCYLAGNFFSAFYGVPPYDGNRTNLIAVDSIIAPWHLLTSPGTLLNSLRLDIISGPYLALGFICVVASYVMAARQLSPDTAAKVMGRPALYAGLATAAIGVFRSVAGSLTGLLGSTRRSHLATSSRRWGHGFSSLSTPGFITWPASLASGQRRLLSGSGCHPSKANMSTCASKPGPYVGELHRW